MKKVEGSYQIVAQPKTVTAGATSAVTTIPDTTAVKTAKVVRLLSDSNGNVFVKPGDASTVATDQDILIGNIPLYLYVGGFTHLAYIRFEADAPLNIAPIEW